MTSYKPNELIYASQNERNRVAVFSEIYYPDDWHLYIDGQEYPLGRANYVLRAAVIPAGQHTIRMAFEPQMVKTDKWSLTFVIMAILISIGIVVWKGYAGLTQRKE